MIKSSIDLNKLEQSPPRTLVKIERSLASTGNETEPSYEVSTLPNLTDLVLVRGPGIVNSDVRLSWSNNLGPRVSGVMGMKGAINPPISTLLVTV